MSGGYSGGSGEKIENVGDVIVEGAKDVSIVDAEDVFIEKKASPYGETAVKRAEDVYIDSSLDHPSVYRDEVVDTSRDTEIRRAEDVVIKPRSVSGDIEVEKAQDVFVAKPDKARVKKVEDVFVEKGGLKRGEATVEDAEDVYLRQDAVDRKVELSNPEDVVLKEGAVRGRVEERESSTQSRYGSTSAVSVNDVEDVIVESGAVGSDVVIENADKVKEKEDSGIF